MRKTTIILMLFVLAVAVTVGCDKMYPKAVPDDEILDGPLAGLSFAQNKQFLDGDIAFNDEVFTAATGLGPLFVASSCGSCHAGDGKGHPFTTLTRFGQHDSTGNLFLHLGGPQLQNRAIPGYLPEQIPAGASFSRFTPPANTGLGFFELVPDSAIFQMADPYDLDGDGISGVANLIALPDFIQPGPHSISMNGKYIHRFGKKAAAFNLLHQTVNAYNQDMGITSTFDPIDTYSGLSIDPEVSDKTIRDVVFYLQTLKAPISRNQNHPDIQAGRDLFFQVGCQNCHKESLQTGYSPIEALSFKTFSPYTDLLLHDMGNELNDGYTEGGALAAEWRTAALWGLGLSPKSQGGRYFLLHDGRANSIDAAIQFHGGEASGSRSKYNQLQENEKQKIIKFLESL